MKQQGQKSAGEKAAKAVRELCEALNNLHKYSKYDKRSVMKHTREYKKRIIILVFLIGFSVQGQIFVQLTEDVKLTFMEDGHGNEPFTLDVSGKVGFHALEGKIGHVKAAFKYEYAELYGGKYTRWALEIGYCFTNLPIPWTGYKYKLTPSFNYGRTERHHKQKNYDTGALDSFEGSFEFAFPIVKGLDGISLLTYTTRPDVSQFGSPNWSVGLEWEIPDFWNTKTGDKNIR